MYHITNNLETTIGIPPNITINPGCTVTLPSSYDCGMLFKHIQDGSITVTEDPERARFIDWANIQKIAIGATSNKSAPVAWAEVMLRSTVDCFVALDDSEDNDPVASNSALFLPAKEAFALSIKPGQVIAVIQSEGAGSLYIAPTR